MLHIINKSPFQTSTLTSCLKMAQAGSALLLIEDGVYAATVGSTTEAQIRAAAANIKVYVLQPDTDARGISSKIIDVVSSVDYGGFVDLTLQYPTVHSWL